MPNKTDEAQIDHETLFRRLLSAFSAEAVREMLEVIASAPLEVVRTPASGMLMMTMQDCFATPFHLGEVLVTTAEVACNETRGHATVLGQEPDKAVLAASVNALIHDGDEAVLQKVWDLVDTHRQDLEESDARVARFAAATRVSFENMAEEE